MEDQLKLEVLLEKYEIGVDELPNDAQQKINEINDLIDDYEDAQDQQEEDAINNKIEALDNAVCSIIEDFLEKEAAEFEKQQAAKAAAGGIVNPSGEGAGVVGEEPKEEKSSSWFYYF